MITTIREQLLAVRHALDDYYDIVVTIADGIVAASTHLESATTLLDTLIAELEMLCDNRPTRPRGAQDPLDKNNGKAR